MPRKALESESDRYKLWDFLILRRASGSTENVILKWVREARLTVRDRAALNNKLKRLAQVDCGLAIKTKLLAGPIYKHVYKLVIHGDVMLRPMLCRGPIDNLVEYTLLLGAIEMGGKLPDGFKEQAEEHREIVMKDQSRRCPHVRIPRNA
jgi:hypothetical protein